MTDKYPTFSKNEFNETTNANETAGWNRNLTDEALSALVEKLNNGYEKRLGAAALAGAAIEVETSFDNATDYEITD